MRKHVVETRSHESPAGIVAQLGEVGGDARAEVGGIDTAGITIPGTFDLETGVAHFVTNLGGASWEGVPVRDPLQQALGVPTSLINDARAFGFAESRLGAARDCDTAAFFTLGTGVGGAVVVGRRLQLGYGSAGELGHMTVDGSPGRARLRLREPRLRRGARAGVGGRARPAGATTRRRSSRRRTRATQRALDALAEAGRWLGVAIANVVVVLNPERVVIGGGVAEAGDLHPRARPRGGSPARAHRRRRTAPRSSAPSSATRPARSARRCGARSTA